MYKLQMICQHAADLQERWDDKNDNRFLRYELSLQLHVEAHRHSHLRSLEADTLSMTPSKASICANATHAVP